MSRSLDPRTFTRRLTTCLAMLGVAMLLVLTSPGRAEAHSELELSEPGQGQVLAEPPRQLVLRFTEAVSVRLADIRLEGPGGGHVPLGNPVHPAYDDTTVTVPIREKIGGGDFTITFHLVSADSHPVEGVIRFSVQGAVGRTAVAAPAGQATSPATPAPAGNGAAALAALAGIARWGGYVGLALLVGPAALLALSWPQGGAVRRVRLLLWSGWAGTTACAVLALATFGPHALGLPLARVLDLSVLSATLAERPGHALAARLLLLAGAWVVLLRLSGPRGTRPPMRPRAAGVAVLAAGAALASTFSLATHSAVGPGAPVALTADVVHLVAMAVWVGGLALVVCVILPARDLDSMRAVLPVFSRAAAICVAALAVTGTFQAWRQTRSVEALLQTSYGDVLLAKLALALCMVALGGVARHWLNRRLLAAEPASRSRKSVLRERAAAVVVLRRTVLAETGIAVVVLVLSSVLVTTEPARVAYAAAHRAAPAKPTPAGPRTARVLAPKAGTADPGGSPPPAVPFDAHGGPADRGQVLMLLEPGRVGQNGLHVAVVDGSGRPSAVQRVALALVPADGGNAVGVDLASGGAGHYAGIVTLPSAGSWRALMMIGLADGRTATIAYPLRVAP